MCIAIYKSPDAVVTEAHLRNSFMRNGDGAGFAVVRNGKMRIRKGFMSFEEFYAAYAEEVKPEDPALIHFRIKTAGKVDPVNCHPWAIGDEQNPEVCFIHNGTLSGFIDETTGLSDTGNFRNAFLNEIHATHGYKFPFTSWINYSLQAIANTSRLAFLDRDGDCIIINEESGVWYENCWFSNESFKSAPISQTKQPHNGVVGIQAFTFRPKGGGEIVLFGEKLGQFLTSQTHIKGSNHKKLKKLVRSGQLKPVSLSE